MRATYVALPNSPSEESTDSKHEEEKPFIGPEDNSGDEIPCRFASTKSTRITYTIMALVVALAVAQFAAVVYVACQATKRVYLDELPQPNVSTGLPRSRYFPSQVELAHVHNHSYPA